MTCFYRHSGFTARRDTHNSGSGRAVSMMQIIAFTATLLTMSIMTRRKRMPEPESKIRIGITDNMVIDGISVHMGFRISQQEVRVIHFDEQGRTVWETIDPMLSVEPSMLLSNDFGRALLDALLRHYQGASDMHTLRSDYLHERGRVDKLTDVIGDIAKTQSRYINPPN
jgi:hypothetical protein